MMMSAMMSVTMMMMMRMMMMMMFWLSSTGIPKERLVANIAGNGGGRSW